MVVALIALLVISTVSSLQDGFDNHDDDFGWHDDFDGDFNKVNEQEFDNDQVEPLEAIHKLRKKYLFSSPKV